MPRSVNVKVRVVAWHQDAMARVMVGIPKLPLPARLKLALARALAWVMNACGVWMRTGNGRWRRIGLGIQIVRKETA